MPRIPYVAPEELPTEKRSLLDTLSDKEVVDRDHDLEGGTLNVYRALGNNVELLEAFRAYGSAVWDDSGLDPEEREVVILTTAHQTGCAYEWHQHVRVALDEGMSRNQIRAISSNDLDQLPPRLSVLVSYVRAFVANEIGQDVHAELREFYDTEQIVGIGLLSGCYLGLGRLLQALAVEPEVEFVGWDLAAV